MPIGMFDRYGQEFWTRMSFRTGGSPICAVGAGLDVSVPRGSAAKVGAEWLYRWSLSGVLTEVRRPDGDIKLKLAGQGTLKKGADVMNIYRGSGLTVVTKPTGEWVTALKSGKGWIERSR